MGKGIDNLKLKKRSEKLAFLEVKDGATSEYHRLEGFTTQTHNANASEYDRRYVDEDTNRVDVTGYSESINYNFDYYLEHPALEEIVKITEGEKIGTDAVRNVVVVDMTTINQASGNNFTAKATIRPFAIVPSSNGDSTDCQTYSGDFKSRGEKENITVVRGDKDWNTITIQENASATAVNE